MLPFTRLAQTATRFVAAGVGATAVGLQRRRDNLLWPMIGSLWERIREPDSSGPPRRNPPLAPLPTALCPAGERALGAGVSGSRRAGGHAPLRAQPAVFPGGQRPADVGLAAANGRC